MIGERIRDKFAASRRKGMWMGGNPPLGYDVRDRKLVVNETEAELVRLIFKRFLRVGSATKLAQELRRAGHTTKSWTTQDGNRRRASRSTSARSTRSSTTASTSARRCTRARRYPGEHEAIIDRATWDKVHADPRREHRRPQQTARARRRRRCCAG